MKSLPLYFVLFCSLLLSACGNKAAGSGAHGEHDAYKPSMDVKWVISGSTLIVDVNTDMHMSKEHVGQSRHDGEGHIHMYLDDGEKITVTEKHQEFPNLSTGKHNLKISLHNNDHTPYDVTKTIDFEIK